jgi:restriction system protein
MAVPDYESLMLPLLQGLADGKEHANRDLREALAKELGLTDADRRELLPSGKQPVFNNRLGWAKTYLEKAGLVRTIRRGVYQLTADGQALLKKEPNEVSNETLGQYESFRSFIDGPGDDVGGAPVAPVAISSSKATPQEQLESAYRELRRQTEQELLDLVLKASPAFFERLVIDLLVRMGYGGTVEDAGKALGRSGDGGIDGLIKEDPLGLDAVYIQAKRWQNTVGRPDVQAFAGSLEGERARKGVFITTSSFTKEAREYVARIDKRIVLIDGVQLASLMFDHGVGVAGVSVFEVKRIDSDYFDEG